VADRAHEEGEIPRQFPNVPPPEIAGAAQTRLLIKAIEDTVKDLKDDVRDIKSHRHSDLILHLSVFVAGFLVLGGMLIAGYFRLDDRIDKLTETSIRVDTKLEDLLQRLPPVQAPVQKSKQ
jgi:hypothetical protein